jgi:hypothetical protein
MNPITNNTQITGRIHKTKFAIRNIAPVIKAIPNNADSTKTSILIPTLLLVSNKMSIPLINNQMSRKTGRIYYNYSTL